jgi:hypothetical protein
LKRHLHWWFSLLFLLVLGYDMVVWGAAARFPDIGPHLQLSALREAPLAYAYMRAGSYIDAASPALEDWGAQTARNALGGGTERIKDDGGVAMDLIFSETWNSSHTTLKIFYWAAPILGFLCLVLWARRPKKVSLMGGRR